MSKLTPRPYQKRAIDASIQWMKKNTESCVLDLSMSAGKSIIAAFIAHEMHKISGGKKVLVLCPNATLVQQNAEKQQGVSEIFFRTAVNEKSVTDRGSNKTK